MNRTAVMTLGLLLLFFGVQLNVVDSYVLTPRMTNFLSEQLPSRPLVSPNVNPPAGQYSQVGFTPYATNANASVATPAIPRGISRTIRPPSWLGWPIMFLGAVFFLNGLAIRR